MAALSVSGSRRTLSCFYGKQCSQQKVRKWVSTLTNADVRIRRNELFNKEQQRQKELTTRLEKIEVEIQEPSYGCTLLMNKHLSTPFDCAMHINKVFQRRTALALVDGTPWDMHRPLEDKCTLEFLHFRIPEPQAVNKAYWRSCSFLLGMALERSFKDSVLVDLHSWPGVNVASGSFIYDVDLNMGEWKPRQDEIQAITTVMNKIGMENIHFERLKMDVSVAAEMFKDNKHKSSQIENIAKASTDGSSVTMYRVKDHIDISGGPMISHTGLIGKISLVSVHPVKVKEVPLLRFQGVSLPHQLMVSQFAYEIIKDRARSLNVYGLAI